MTPTPNTKQDWIEEKFVFEKADPVYPYEILFRVNNDGSRSIATLDDITKAYEAGQRVEREPKSRREYLLHADDCDMGKFGKYQNCSCHYTDCLDYKGWKQMGNCICRQLTAKTLHADYMLKRARLPFWKRIFTRKYTWFYFLDRNESFNPLNPKDV